MPSDPVVVDELFYDIHIVGGLFAAIMGEVKDLIGEDEDYPIYSLANEGESLLDSVEERLMQMLNVSHSQRILMVEEESKRRKEAKND